MAVLDILRGVLGVALLLAPGAALVWALLPGLDRPKAVAVAVVLAFTVVPLVVLALNVVVRVPITGWTFVVVCLVVTGAAVGWRLGWTRGRGRENGV